MEEERYTIENFEIEEPSVIFDNKTNQIILTLVDYDYEEITHLQDLLNHYFKRIKELENMNSRLSQGIYWGNGEHFCDVVKRYKAENEQLKEELKNYKSYKTDDERIKNLTDLYEKYTTENQQLKQQLAEKEKELKKIKDLRATPKQLQRAYQERYKYKERCNELKNQHLKDKISFAVEQLEKVNGVLTDTILEVAANEFDTNRLCYLEEKFYEKIDQQINELKGEKV